MDALIAKALNTTIGFQDETLNKRLEISLWTSLAEQILNFGTDKTY